MRKTLTQALLAAFCAILARGTSAAHVEGGGVMQIASRVSMWSGARMPTAKDYVQSGLVAMFDGIENGGYGIHNPNAGAVWTDNVGGQTFSGGTYCNYNGLNCYEYNVASTVYSRGIFKTASFSPQNLVNSYNFTAQFLLTPTNSPFNYTIRTESSQVFAAKNGNTFTDVWLYNTLYSARAGGVELLTFTADGSTMKAYRNETKFAEAAIDTSVVCNANAFAFMRVGANRGTFYNRALSAQEIARSYAIDKERFGLT